MEIKMKERGPDRREKARRKKKSELLPNKREEIVRIEEINNIQVR